MQDSKSYVRDPGGGTAQESGQRLTQEELDCVDMMPKSMLHMGAHLPDRKTFRGSFHRRGCEN